MFLTKWASVLSLRTVWDRRNMFLRNELTYCQREHNFRYIVSVGYYNDLVLVEYYRPQFRLQFNGPISFKRKHLAL
jgi:hypothetical protein